MSTNAHPRWLVVDTDVASFLFNGDPVRMPRYSSHLRGKSPILPFAVVAEMLYGARAGNWGSTRLARLELFLGDYRVEYPSYAVCSTWARVRAICRSAGRPIGPQDAWMAATALHLDVPLVTHNAQHFVQVPGLHIITRPDTSR